MFLQFKGNWADRQKCDTFEEKAMNSAFTSITITITIK